MKRKHIPPNEELSPFGRITVARMDALGKDILWLQDELRARQHFARVDQLIRFLTGEFKSTAKEYLVGVILHEEEEREKLKKIARIKK